MNDLTIGQLAKKFEVRTNTIRYYEPLETIQSEGRSYAGYRFRSGKNLRHKKI